MPRYTTEVAHTLGKEEALARLKALTEQARSYSDLKGTWSENTFEFSVSAQGIHLSGALQVEADVLKLDSKLPLIAMPFVTWIPRVLKKGLEQSQSVDGAQLKSAAESLTRSISPPAPPPPVVLFMHIPKAAGLTLGDYVYSQCRAEEAGDADVLNAGVAYLNYGFIKEPELAIPDHVRVLLSRSDLRAVIGHFWFGLHQEVERPSTYITMLRNPIDRVSSLYYYAKINETMTLDEFMDQPPFKEVDNDQTRRIAGVDPPIGECDRAMLEQAKEHLRRHFSVVGTTERFDESLLLLKRKLGWNKEIISYPRNVNTARPETRSLSPKTIEAIRKRNELDLELWEYASQLLDEAILAEGSGFRDELERYKSSLTA